MSGATKRSKTLAVSAAVLLLFAIYGQHWSRTHGAFCERKINIPLELKEQSIEISFSVPEDGSHYIELRSPQSGSFDVASALQEVQGTCTLRRNGQALIQRRLPTDAMIGGDDSLGTILIEFNASRSSHYSLALKTDHVPAALRSVSGILRIEIDLRSYKTIAVVAWLSSLAAFVSLFCMLVLTYLLYSQGRGVKAVRNQLRV